MKPLIKYTGGKYSEYKKIKQYFPKEINNYYEPFFGGGGVFFRLKEENKIKGKSFASDLSDDLIDFYNCICKEEFAVEVKKIESAWEEIHKISNLFCGKYDKLFFDIITGKEDISKFINKKLTNEITSLINGNDVLSKFNFHGFSLSKRIFESIFDKTKKFIKKDISEPDNEISCKSLETSIHQGFYFTIRDMYNDWLVNGEGNYAINERAAQWYYIREFCFGGMFRFGSDGRFNIPYGGAVYNGKDFSNKIKILLSDETKKIISSALFKVCDFEEALNTKFEDNDFVFLDPPYDSIFSEYDNNSFTREDHKRLHDILVKLNCKWLMAIGKTEFIDELYKEFEKIEYNKTYAYQARGTYDSKRTSHLIIKNF
jgi:DNA adenine methylase